MGIQIGKLGPAVGSMWKGKNVYRSYNPFVKPPPTLLGSKSRELLFLPARGYATPRRWPNSAISLTSPESSLQGDRF